jgi:hypothetical protein
MPKAKPASDRKKKIAKGKNSSVEIKYLLSGESEVKSVCFKIDSSGSILYTAVASNEGYPRNAKINLLLPHSFLGNRSERINFADPDAVSKEWIVRKSAVLDKRFVNRLNNEVLILNIIHLPKSFDFFDFLPTIVPSIQTIGFILYIYIYIYIYVCVFSEEYDVVNGLKGMNSKLIISLLRSLGFVMTDVI